VWLDVFSKIKYLACGRVFDIIYQWSRSFGGAAAIPSMGKRNHQEARKRGYNMAEMIRILLKRNPFIRGMVRVIDLGCVLDRELKIENGPVITDWEKIGGDWAKVGDDFRTAIEKYQKETADVQA
jgi:hypothetical protein